MKTMNELLHDCITRLDERERQHQAEVDEQRRREAARRGIARAREILSEKEEAA